MFNSVFIVPFLRLRLSIPLLLTVNSQINVSLAVSCFGFPPISKQLLLSDCSYIHAHIPSFHAPGPDSLIVSRTGSSPSFPFFPTADFDHGSCSISLSVEDPTRHRPPPVLQSDLALEVWTKMKAGVTDIIKECIDEHMSGFDMGEVADLSWQVMITESRLTDSHREDQKREMEQNEPRSGGRVAHYGNLLYSTTFYDV